MKNLCTISIKHVSIFVKFFHFSLVVGEKCDVKLEVYVDKKSAGELNSSEDNKLYDILVLHLEGGKDIFITVTGKLKFY